MGCNLAQNEVGGKSLLLKICSEELDASSSSGSSSLTVTAHGGVVGDLVRFTDAGTSSVVNTTDFYFLKAVVDANTFTISATRGGAAILLDLTSATLNLEIFKSIGGLRSKSMSFSSEGIDVTSHDSDEWNKLLNGAGIRSFEVSGSGVYTNEEVFQDMRSRAMLNELVCLMLIDVSADRIYEGCFKITSLEISGDYDAEGNFSISATSSDEVQVVVPS